MRARGFDHALNELAGVAMLNADVELAGIELADEQQVVDDIREPRGLFCDHLEQLLAHGLLELEIGTSQGQRRSVDRGERRAQLVRHRRDEILPHLLEGSLLREVAERVHGSAFELDARHRQPELTATRIDGDRICGDRRARRADRHTRQCVCEGGPHVMRTVCEHLFAADPRDRLGRRVPQTDDTVGVEQHHAVADRSEHPRRLCAFLRLPVEARVVDRRRGAAGKLLRHAQVVFVEAASGFGADERDRAHDLVTDREWNAHVRPEAELADQVEVELVDGGCVEHLVGDLRYELGLPAADDAHRALVDLGVRRVALPQLARECHLCRICVRERERVDAAVGLEEVDGAPVRDLGNGKPRDGLQRAPIVERAGEHLAGAQQEVLRLLGSLLCVDLGRGPDPEFDLARVVAERDGSTEVPAVAPVFGAEAVLDLEHFAAGERPAPQRQRALEVLRMNDADPLVSLWRPGFEARVLVPAAVVVGGLAVRTRGPDDLRHRVGERAVPVLALTARRSELALSHQLGPALQLHVLAVEIDEHRDLRTQDLRVERLEEIVDCAGRIAAKNVMLLLRDRGEEDDRDRTRLLPLSDQPGSLEAVELGHLDVEQDHGDVVQEQPAERLLAGPREDEILAERLEDRLQRDEVLMLVVDKEDVRLVVHVAGTVSTHKP